MEQLQYPIGKFEFGKSYSAEQTSAHIAAIEQFPGLLKTVVSQLTPSKLAETYRPGGWTPGQIIHHLADSHLNAYIRFKLTITEDLPVIKPYNQDTWANLEDSRNAPLELSVALIDSIHQRWMFLLKVVSGDDLKRKYVHPEYKREFRLDELLALYAWHGKHHLEHLKIILS